MRNSARQSEVPCHETDNPGGGKDSRPELEELGLDSDRLSKCSSGTALCCERPVHFEDELQSFFEISASFSESSALSIYSGNLLHPGGIPPTMLFENGSDCVPRLSSFHCFSFLPAFVSRLSAAGKAAGLKAGATRSKAMVSCLLKGRRGCRPDFVGWVTPRSFLTPWPGRRYRERTSGSTWFPES